MFLPKPLTFIQKLRARLSRPVVMFLMCVCAVVLITVSSLAIAAQSNRNKPLMYQGRLTTTANIPVADGNYNVSFVIYDALTSGNCKWATGASETSGQTNCSSIGTTSVAVSRGLFTSPIGDDDASITGMPPMNLDFDTASFFLEVRVGGETLTPRKRIGSAPYSYNADEIDGITSGSFLRSDANSTDTAQLSLNAVPTGSGVGAGSAYINPASASANYTLLGVAVNGTQKAKIDAEGDLTTAGNLTVSGTSDNSMTGNMIWSVDNTYDIGASGANRPRRGYFATEVVVGGTVTISTNSIVGSGATTLSSTSGNLTLSTVTSGDIVLTPTGSGKVGVGTASPAAKLQVTSLSGSQVNTLLKNTQTGTGLFMESIGGTGADEIKSMKQTSDGGFILTGSTDSYGAGSTDVLAIKLTNAGAVSFAVTIGGTGAETGWSTQETSDGGFIIAGDTASYGAGSSDVFLVKLTAAGAVSFAKTAGSTSSDAARSVHQSTDGGYIVAGNTSGFGVTQALLLMKFTSTGTLSFTKTVDGVTDTYPANGVRENSDGSIVVTGTTTAGAGTTALYLAKFTSSGTLSWMKTVGGSSSNSGNAVRPTSDGGYIAAGSTSSFGAGGSDLFIVKFDSAGAVEFAKTYGGVGNDSAADIEQASDGGYIIGGHHQATGFDALLLKLTSSGTVEFSKSVSTTSFDAKALSVQERVESGYIIAGLTDGVGAGSNDALVTKFDSSGDVSGCSNILTPSLTVTTQSLTAATESVSETNRTASSGTESLSSSSQSPSLTQQCTAVETAINTALSVSSASTGGKTGVGTASPATRLDVSGLTVNTDADGTVAAIKNAATFTKNDTNTRTFSVAKIVPTFNFGGSNTNTTVNVLDIDTTNTAVTGLTTNLLKASYGGVQKFAIDSTGNVSIAGALSSIPGNIIPSADDTYDLGSSSFRWRDLFLGPTSLRLSTTTGETSTARAWKLGVDDSSGSGPSGFAYRRAITITSGASQTNYQIPFTLDTATLISNSKMQADCDDIRVTSSDGSTLIDHFFEGPCNNASTTIWAEVPSIANGSTTIYVYYGNSGASSVSSAANTFVREIASTSPVVRAWRLDENTGQTAADYSGNSGTLTLGSTGSSEGNDPSWTGSGKFGAALSFDGGDRATFGNVDMNVMSVTMWIQRNNTNGRLIMPISSGGWGFYLESSNNLAFGKVGNSQAGLSSGSISDTSSFHQVAFTYDGSTVSYYIDGSASGTAGYSETFNSSGSNYTLGSRGDGEYFNGVIDEVRIYNRVLTSGEISDLYNNYGYVTTNYAGKELVRKRVASEPSPSVGSEAGTGSPTQGNLRFMEGSSQYLTVATDGKIGIGTAATAPASLLHVPGIAQLGTASTTTGQLKMFNSGSANYAAIQAGSAGSALTFTWPTSYGTNGQVLTSNGLGGLSWTTPSGGGGNGWTDDGTAVRLTTATDFVAIGTTTAVARLTIEGGGISIGGTPQIGDWNPRVPGTNTITTLDSTGAVGSGTAITIPPDGLPVIAYNDDTNDDLKVIKCANISCSSISSTNTVDNTGDVGDYPSIAIGTDGFPVIAYIDTVNSYLKFIKCGNAACSTGSPSGLVTDGTVGGRATSIAVGTDGFPVISYYGGTQDLKALKCGNASCSSGNTNTALDTTGDVGYNNVIGVAPDGIPIIAYYDVTNANLKVIKCSDAACSGAAATTTVDSTGDVGGYFFGGGNMSFTSDGFMIVSYKDNTNGDLKIYKCSNTNCTSGTATTVATTGDVGYSSSLTIGNDGLPIIAHYDASDVFLTKCTNIGCTSAGSLVTVDSTGDVGAYTSLAIGVDGLPIFTYWDITNDNLKVVHCANQYCINNWNNR